MGYDVVSAGAANTTPITTIDTWVQSYKNRHLELSHDQSQLALVNPDDSLVVAGPARLASTNPRFYVVGFLNSLNFGENRMVQPMKAIGSKRHIFSSTNAPVQGSISRLMFHGPNLARALYAVMNSTGLSELMDSNTEKFSVGSSSNPLDSIFFTNLEEDLYCFPIGLGIIYRTPAHDTQGRVESVGAEYIESFVLANRQVSIQAGQSMVMENVSFMADRVMPWDSYSSSTTFGNSNPVEQLLL